MMLLQLKMRLLALRTPSLQYNQILILKSKDY
jgi:hypothetical protein